MAPKGSGMGGSRYGGASGLRVKVEMGSNSLHSSKTPRSSPLSYVSKQWSGAGDIKLKPFACYRFAVYIHRMAHHQHPSYGVPGGLQ